MYACARVRARARVCVCVCVCGVVWCGARLRVCFPSSGEKKKSQKNQRLSLPSIPENATAAVMVVHPPILSTSAEFFSSRPR